MLLKTKLVATGVAATLTAGLGAGIAFNGAEKLEVFEKNHSTVHESATEMDNAKSTIDSLVEKIKVTKGELEDKGNELTSAKEAFKKANTEVAIANTFVEGLSRMAKEQTDVLTSSKEKLKSAMENAQSYLNDNSETSNVK